MQYYYQRKENKNKANTEIGQKWNLCHLDLLCSSIQQYPDGVDVPLPRSDVQRCVTCSRGRVRASLVLQEQLDKLLVAHTSRTVQGCLIILGVRKQR